MKADIEAAQLEEERATREGDLARASELRFGRIPELQEQLKAATAALEARQADGTILKEEVTEDEIAEVVSSWTGIPITKDDARRNGKAHRS